MTTLADTIGLAIRMKTIATEYASSSADGDRLTRDIAIREILAEFCAELFDASEDDAETLIGVIWRGPFAITYTLWSAAFPVEGTVRRRPDPEKVALSKFTKTIGYIQRNRFSLQGVLFPRTDIA